MNFTREPSGNLHSFRTKDETHYYLTDALGTVEAVANSQGEKVNWYYYSPNGITDATEQVPQPHRFTGGYQDPTGLYHFNARYYDPQIGRFTQPDPSGLSTNPYLYASGDPANRIDPSGLIDLGGIFGSMAVGSAAAFAVGTAIFVSGGSALVAATVGAAVGGCAGGAYSAWDAGGSPLEIGQACFGGAVLFGVPAYAGGILMS
ncbi:RHS repeat-associated core domain-containing protein [Streptomyces ferrugineus]|uniref:RHS repeat-associated core domain-containing protein n=1 Tax=Streptomyces ferrugineus TaxID=1413221 RepID=A0A7M2SQH4_9ACTN|nr:RHS repeat-associated core domain-containing protein [Streptomyces ferrugineus]QOV37743.1 RHS repeat-associated core domain-containing protein [Streptomyces ferrugineus]